VRRPRDGICVGVVSHQNRVQFAHVSDGQLLLAAGQHSLDPGDCQACLMGNAQSGEMVGHDGRGAELLETELWMDADVLSQGRDLVAVRVDTLANSLLQFLHICHVHLSSYPM